MYRLMSALMLSGLVAGCSTVSSFEKEQLMENQSGGPLQYDSARTVEEVAALKPQLKFPMRLVVAQPAAGAEWSREEIEEIESWRSTLQDKGFVSELIVLPDRRVSHCNTLGPSCSREGDRMLAARFQADALLEIVPRTASDEWANPASILNLTLVGMWLVPAHHVQVDVQLEGALIDVRNEYVYAFVRSFGSESSVRPLIYSSRENVEQAARLQGLRRFGERLLVDVGGQKNATVNP